jgi:hypothetical protein
VHTGAYGTYVESDRCIQGHMEGDRCIESKLDARDYLENISA